MLSTYYFLYKTPNKHVCLSVCLSDQGGAFVERRWTINYRVTPLVPHSSSCVTSGLVQRFGEMPNTQPCSQRLSSYRPLERARRGGKMRDPGNEIVNTESLESLSIDRSPSLGACNSHTEPMSRHFYRPVYF